MWLLIDIGNSSVKVGVFDPTQAEYGSLITSKRIEPEADAGLEIRRLVQGLKIDRVGCVSVVPALNPTWQSLAAEVSSAPVSFFNSTSRLPFTLKYATPKTLGNDRIAVAAGGWVQFGKPVGQGVIVVDAGTAINYEVVTAEGDYLGGVIAPGPGLMRQALGSGTAQLPQVELERPISRIGTSTDEAIRSGIMFGLRDSVQAMIEGIQVEQRAAMQVVLTGGWGKWLSSELKRPVEPELVLKGVAELMRCSAK